MKTFLLFLLSFVPLVGARGEPLEIGVAAPDVRAVNQDGETVVLGELYEKGVVLVYFYPKASTPGCTAQACSLRDEYGALRERGVRIVGVSMDSVEAQKRFQQAYQLPFPLLADEAGKVVEAFGVPKHGNFASRQAYLIHGGKVVWRDLSASTEKQAADVLKALDRLELN